MNSFHQALRKLLVWLIKTGGVLRLYCTKSRVYAGCLRILRFTGKPIYCIQYTLESSVQFHRCIVVSIPQEGDPRALLQYSQQVPLSVPVHTDTGAMERQLCLHLTSTVKDVHSIVSTNGESRGQYTYILNTHCRLAQLSDIPHTQ